MCYFPALILQKLRFALSATCLVWLAAMPCYGTPQAQQPTPALEDNKPATSLRVTTRLVEVNVVVNDKNGKPIIGLGKDSFTLLDDKKTQRIEFLSIDANAPTKQPVTQLPPDTYTNRVAGSPAQSPNVTVILFDALNTERTDQILARRQVLKVLDQLPPESRVALYWLGAGLYILSDFTADAAILRQALANYRGESSRQLANSQDSDPRLHSPNPSVPAGLAGAMSERDAFRSAFDQRIANAAVKNRAGLTLAALVAIAHHIRGVRGRKNLVWVSSSFPLTLGQERFDLNWSNDTGENFQQDTARAARILTDANIAVYPVDARGILGSGENAAGVYTDATPPEFAGEGDEHLPSRVAPANLDTMKLLAERTGGRAFYGTNDLSGAIIRALNDSRATYTLGFYPSESKWDGAFHKIKVRVAVPGAEVRARSGYFALPDAPLSAPKADHHLIAQLASSQLLATGIGLYVRAEALTDSTLIAEAHVDLREINMQPRDGHWIGTLQSIFLQLDNTGRILHVDDRTFHSDFDDASYQQGLQRGITDTRRVRVLPDAAQLCIVVRDANSSSMGSVYLPVAKYVSQSPEKTSPRQ
jgi:VWFA-related protein